MKNYLAKHNEIAVSANLKETAINTYQTLDTALLVAKNTILGIEPRTEDNKDELTGKEEADTIYNLGNLSSLPLAFDKAQAQHFGFGLSFGLGSSTPSAYGTGHKHTIVPTADISNPSFTAAMRLGKTIGKRRAASFFVDTLKAKFDKDKWAGLDISAKGTGKYDESVTAEIVNAAYNAAELTLAANGVQGSDAASRLDSVHRIRVQVPVTGEWKEVAVTAVSNAVPAVITITAPGVPATLCNYEILYAPVEAVWGSFPDRVSEPPLRVTDLVLVLGGKWNGAAFLGGRTLSSEIESIEYSLNNKAKIEYRVGGTGSYANSMMRDGRVQTLGLDRQMRDYILQRHLKDNEYFGVRMTATGAEFETGKNYYVDLVFPRCGVLKAPISVNGNVLAEKGDLAILQDDDYGSVIATVANMVSGYAQ